MKKCPFCKAEIEENSRFCIHCMSPLEPKKAAAKIRPSKKRWQIISAVLLVFTTAIVLVLSTAEKGADATLGFLQVQTETDTSDILGSNLVSTDSDSSQNSTQDTSNGDKLSTNSRLPIARPHHTSSSFSNSSDYPEYELPDWYEDLFSSDLGDVSSVSASTSSKTNSTTASTSSRVSSTSASTSSKATSTSSSTPQSFTEGYYTYSVSDGKATITDVYNKISGAVTIPSTLGGYPVVTIGSYAFSGCTLITSVVIPNSVTVIKDRGFEECSSLKKITIPDSVKDIGVAAFTNCVALTSIKIPYGVPSIGNRMFEGCSSLASITIPNSVTSIGIGSFGYCRSLKNIEIPNSVKSLGWYSFWYCDKLENMVIPNSVTSIGMESFYYCDNLKSITFGSGIEVIGAWFKNCNVLESVTIKEGATKIASNAFSGYTSLKRIYIPESLTQISNDAFESCNFLTDIYYAGSSEQRSSINIGTNNDALNYSATWHYNSNY